MSARVPVLLRWLAPASALGLARANGESDGDAVGPYDVSSTKRFGAGTGIVLDACANGDGGLKLFDVSF